MGRNYSSYQYGNHCYNYIHIVTGKLLKMEREFNEMKDVFKVLPTTQEEKEYMIVIGKHLATNEKFPSHDRGRQKKESTP